MAGTVRLVDLLGGLSMVADYGFGLPPGTAVRSCLVAAALARRLNLTDDDVRDSFYTALLMHIGCVGVAHEAASAFGDDLALNRAVAHTDITDPNDIVATFLPRMTIGMTSEMTAQVTAFTLTGGAEWGRRTDVGVCEVARDTARRLGLPRSTQQALYHVYESWSGGYVPSGLRADEIAIASRVARAAMDAAFFGQLGGPEGAVTALRRRAGGILDPAVVDAFTADPESILAEVDDNVDHHDRMLTVEPDPVLTTSAGGMLELATTFGDLADIKVPSLHGHSRKVARLAAGAARRLRLGEEVVRQVEIAGLLHDVGRVGVSNRVWEKPGPLTRMDREQVRMHAYYSERILATSPALQPLAVIVGMHHERLDGSGYHRGCTAAALPLRARVLAVADAFAGMLHARPHRPALTPEQAAAVLRDETRAGRFDHDAAAAVLAEAGHGGRAPARPRPGGLSDREIEVLALVAAGCSNADIAGRLVISRRTAEHHVQHIYAKIGVSSRAAAALFAVQHEIIPERIGNR